MSGLLNGIRVLDFGRYIAGPYCATLLADLGADVIRIEKPDGGEDRYTVPISDQGEGAYYIQLGRNKRAMTLNPRSEQGQKIIQQLVATADVVVANLPAQALVKLGLDYANLCKAKSDIILTTGSAFGAVGPYAQRGGFDTVAQAMSGAMYLSGEPQQPAKSFAPYCDFGTAALCAFGTLAAIMHRNLTGEGQVVEGSLLSTALNFNNAALMEEAALNLGRQGTGTRGQYNGPTDSFKTQDGWVTVQVVGAGLYKRWANLIEEAKWHDDKRFESDQLRGDHGSEISQRMNEWCQERTNSQVVETLTNAGIPCGELLSPQQVLQNEHVQQGEFFSKLKYPGVEQAIPVANHPVRYSSVPVEAVSPAPSLGQHTTEILAELGYSNEQQAELAKLGVI